MSELTKEYLNEALSSFGQKLEEKFDEFAGMVAKGFSDTVTKKEFNDRLNSIDAHVSRGEKELSFQIAQLAVQVREFVEMVKEQDREYVELKVKYHELEERVKRLEGQRFSSMAA